MYWDIYFGNHEPEEFFVNGVGSFEADPLFCEEPNHLWLEAESPCIGAGETGESIGARYGVCDVTSVPDVVGDSTLPESLPERLHVWPNPSGGGIDIALFRGRAEMDLAGLDLSIFGADGRRLVTLEREVQAHRVSWDGEINGLCAEWIVCGCPETE